MNYYGHGGITSLSPYASGGYVEPYGLGGWLKGIGGLLAGMAGMGIAGPLGAAVASGLFSGVADKSVKSGLLSGLTAYLGGNALRHAGDAVSGVAAATEAGKDATIRNAVLRPGSALAGVERAGLKEGIGALGSSAGRDAAMAYLTDPKKVAFLYPQMGNLAFEPDPRFEQASRGPDPYFAELRRAREQHSRRYGNDPYRGMWGYDEGGLVGPWEQSWWGSLTPAMQARLSDEFYANYPILNTADTADPADESDDDPSSSDLGGLSSNSGTGLPTGWQNPSPPNAEVVDSGVTPITGEMGIDPETGEPVWVGQGGETLLDSPADEEGDYDGGDLGGLSSNSGTGSNNGGEISDGGAGVKTGDDSLVPEFRRRFTREVPSDFYAGIMPEYEYFSKSDTDRGPAPYDPVDYDVFGREQVAGAIDEAGFADYMSDVFGGEVEGMAEGGMVDGGDELVQATLMALMGAIPYEEANGIIEQFVETYGEEALQELMQIAMSMREEQSGPTKSEGMLSGPGGGQGDQIIAPVANADPVALSSGEFIVPADVVAHLGDGDSQTGAAKLQQMMSDVRMQKTGTTQQPAPLAGIAGLR